MAEVVFSEGLIELGIAGTHRNDVIKVLADKLEGGGYVTRGYYDRVIRREETYATGLPTAIPVAICHTEAKYVNQSAMAIGTLAQPVEFHEMGSPEKVIKAEIVFLLALKDHKGKSAFLARLTMIFKDRALLMAIRYAEDSTMLVNFLKEFF